MSELNLSSHWLALQKHWDEIYDMHMLDLFKQDQSLPWRIPSEGRMAEVLDVSRSTVRSALDYLRDLSIRFG